MIEDYFLERNGTTVETPQIYFVDNFVDNSEEQLVLIRNGIIGRCKSEKFPVQWLVLEHILDEYREVGIHCVSKTDFMHKVFERERAENQTLGRVDDTDLVTFLRMQHDMGKIIYFNEASLGDYVIPSPQFLIDAVKSIITGKQFRTSEQTTKLHSDLERNGILNRKLLDVHLNEATCGNFHHYRDHMLAVMEKLSIIARKKKTDGSGDDSLYLVPCMVRKRAGKYVTNPTDVFCVKSPLLELKFSFLPPGVFDRVITAFCSKWPVAEDEHGDPLMFRGCTVFRLNEYYRAVLHLEGPALQDTSIKVIVTRYRQDKDALVDSQICAQVRCLLIDTLEQSDTLFQQKLVYTVRKPASGTYEELFRYWFLEVSCIVRTVHTNYMYILIVARPYNARRSIHTQNIHRCL
jgi:hypothetical protein